MSSQQLVTRDSEGTLAPVGKPEQAAVAESSGVERVTKANCAMDCGQRLPLSQMYRSNARALPYCLPCQNAKRTLIAMANKTPGCKEAMVRLQTDDPDGWKARVRSCRIVDPSAIASGAEGVCSIAARRQVVHDWVSQVKQTMGAREVSGVLWLNKQQFVKHQAEAGIE